jgi:hypothetical protein
MVLFDYLFLLLLGHVLGDFYFQTEKMATAKDKKYVGVILHSLEYAVTIVVVVFPVISLDMLLAAIYLSVIHFVIDTAKYILLKTKKISKNGRIFVIDQVFHVLSILVLAYIMHCWNFKISQFSLISDIFDVFGIEKVVFIRWILSILILHIPTNILIQNLLTGYKPKENNNDLIVIDNKAGRRIGTIERLIMMMFIAVNQYAAMGLVLTAKSIARYDKITKDEKFAEYYLLGTLLSTASVVVCKILFLR